MDILLRVGSFGLGAVLIAYLPTMFDAFTGRETAVSMPEVRAGAPLGGGDDKTDALHLEGWKT